MISACTRCGSWVRLTDDRPWPAEGAASFCCLAPVEHRKRRGGASPSLVAHLTVVRDGEDVELLVEGHVRGERLAAAHDGERWLPGEEPEVEITGAWTETWEPYSTGDYMHPVKTEALHRGTTLTDSERVLAEQALLERGRSNREEA